MSVHAPGSRPRSRKCTPSTATANNHEAPRLRQFIRTTQWVQQVRWSRKHNAATREGNEPVPGKVQPPSRPSPACAQNASRRNRKGLRAPMRMWTCCATLRSAFSGHARCGLCTNPQVAHSPQAPAFTLPISRPQGCVPSQPRAAQRLGGIHTAACGPPAPGAPGVRAEVLQPPQSLQAPHEGALPQPGRRAPKRRRSAAGIQYQAA
jgi:hypothetical protein